MDNVTPIARGPSAPAFKPGEAVADIDEVMAALSMVRDVIRTEDETNLKLNNAWLVLHLVTKKLNELRDALEEAECLKAFGAPGVTHG
jgi:hypothetical protein